MAPPLSPELTMSHRGSEHGSGAPGSFDTADLSPRSVTLRPTIVTIASGVISISRSYHRVETESAAASDDLDTIGPTTVPDGFVLFLSPVADARTVVVKHETGNISAIGGSDITLDDIEDWAQLIYDAPNDQWYASFGKQDVATTKQVNTTAVGNVGAGEDTLITYDLPANTLNTNGAGVRITAWGTVANNANGKTLKVYFGATVILTDGITAGAATRWYVTGLVFRTAVDAQDYVTYGNDQGATTPDINVGTATEDDGAAITIKCTGEATSDNDIVQEGLLVEVL